jgi:hypothetical protein
VEGDISQALGDVLAGKSVSGSTYTVTVSGVNLGNSSHYAALLHGIADGIPSGDIELDLSGCTGVFVDKALIPAGEKARFTEVTLPEATRIDGSAFYNCAALTSVSLGATPPALPGGANDGWFRQYSAGATNVVAITVPSGAASAYENAWSLITRKLLLRRFNPASVPD